MSLRLLSSLALCALICACGGGKPGPAADAGTGGGGGGGGLNTFVCLDNDGDGVPGTGDCTNEPRRDCDDADPKIFPGALELCNGIDDNCDDLVDNDVVFQAYYTDADGDGFGALNDTPANSCSAIEGRVTNHTDCDDTNPNVHPNATETCNGVDDNCAAGVDDGLPFTDYYPDADGDGFGAAGPVTSACSPQAGKVTDNTDCDDTNSTVKPGAAELCNNVDDNCNGTADDGNPGGGAACGTGQPGVCGPGTMTCVSGALSCVRNTQPSAEKCDGLDNDCDAAVDETFSDKNSACSAGVGVCARAGTRVCNAAGTATECSATPGSPTTPSCDGNDNDCDGIVDEPVFTNTVTLQSTAWSDIEVTAYYYSATGCQGGVAGSSSDALAGGAAVMAGGTSGLYFQQLSAAGAPVGAPVSVAASTFSYSDVAIAQAGDGYIIAGLYQSSGVAVEIDFFYVDSAGTKRAQEVAEFARTGTNVLEGLRLMRGNGKRVTAVWRESGVGLKTARVEPFNNAGVWSILTPAQVAGPFTATTLVANTQVMAGVGADSTHIDWFASVNCQSLATLRQQAVAYIAPVGTTDHSVRYFTMVEDGTSKSAETTIETRANSSRLLAEPEVAHYRRSNAIEWMVAFTESGLSSANEDLRYFLSHTYDGTTLPFDYAYQAYATDNGSDSISRPRATVTSTAAFLSANRYVKVGTAAATKQVMTRKIVLATNTKDPVSTTAELSATTAVCPAGATDCRPGAKAALTNFAGWSTGVKVYYSNSGSPAGANASTLTCN